MKNAVKNPRIMPEGIPFTPDNQPSPELKKQGWERKRQAQAFMDKVMEYQNLTAEQFDKLATDIQLHKNKFTVRDLLAFRYASKTFNNDKFMLDWIDRHVSHAPTKTELSGENGEPITIGINEADKKALKTIADELASEEIIGGQE